MPPFRFTLFVAGDSLRSRAALSNLRRIADGRVGAGYEIRVVDVLAEPQRAEDARILTTPTVVRDAPEPVRRVTGDLSNQEVVVAALDLPGSIQETAK